MTTPLPEIARSQPTFAEALRFWWRLGWISFGGPTGQIAIMHTELVERKGWIDQARFLHGLNFCMLLPGPEAQQLATYLGWRLHGVRGALAAGVLFVLPAVFILWGLSVIYIWYGRVPWIEAAFYGLMAAIIGIVFNALFRLAEKTLIYQARWFIAFAAAFALTAMPHINDLYPFVIFSAGLLGWLWRGSDPDYQKSTVMPTQKLAPLPYRAMFRNALVCLAAWFAPLIILGFALGWNHTIVREGLFFSKAALVTFGGAYAVLPYVAQQAVENYQWLDAEQMFHGFGLAETTPGPLIMVLQFVGFLGAWHQPGALSPLLSATLGALLTSWVTFAPSFLYILTGGPVLDRLENLRSLKPVLGAISAAVVGVMAHFAVFFTWKVVLGSGEYASGQADFLVFGLGVVAFAALRWGKVGIIPLIFCYALLGILLRTL